MEDFNRLLIVLTGKTGSGKTEVLKALKELNSQVIDLELLANHNGSAFGFTSKTQIPSKKEFRTNLLKVFSTLSQSKPVFIEWKGKHLGPNKIPFELVQAMRNAPKIRLERDIELRVQHIAMQYQSLPEKILYHNLFLLRPRLSSEEFDKALDSLDKNDFPGFIRSFLSYYDNSKNYQYPDRNIMATYDSGKLTPDKIAGLILMHLT